MTATIDEINGKLTKYHLDKPLLVIIAGGGSKSFAPLTTTKTLFQFCGKPLLQYTLEMAKRVGLVDILIATSEANHEWISQFKLKGVSIKVVKQKEPKGMADALLTLEEDIGERPIIVKSAADIVEDSFLKNVLDKKDGAYAVVPAIRVKENFPGGYIQTEGERAVGIIEKPAAGAEPSDLVILTAHYFSKPRDFIHILKEVSGDSDDHYEQALARLMQEQEVTYVTYEGGWKKLKYSFHVLDVMNYILSNKIEGYKARSAQVSPNAHISGNVYIDEDAKVLDTAVIVGPAYIGKHAFVGQHTLIRESMVEEHAVVGFGSEVNRSYIGRDTKLHHNTIADSVLEHDVNPSYGTSTANLRIDGKLIDLKLPDKTIPTSRRKLGTVVASGAFFGVNCSIMPGVTIGEHAKVYPGTIVYSPIKSNTIVKSLQNQEVEEQT